MNADEIIAVRCDFLQRHVALAVMRAEVLIPLPAFILLGNLFGGFKTVLRRDIVNHKDKSHIRTRFTIGHAAFNRLIERLDIRACHKNAVRPLQGFRTGAVFAHGQRKRFAADAHFGRIHNDNACRARLGQPVAVICRGQRRAVSVFRIDDNRNASVIADAIRRPN